jgi:transposase
MFQVTPQMRILVAVEPVDGRKGIDSLACLCRQKLEKDPFSGSVFLFRNRRGTILTLLNYDGQGFWLARKRLSKGKFRWWPTGSESSRVLEAYQAQILMAAGDPSAKAAPVWRAVRSPDSKAG